VITLGHDATAQIIVTGDVTGGTSASFASTTISGFNLANDTITFGNAAGTLNDTLGGQVNVATATSLANALDLAASQAGQVAANTGVVEWFQYQGNTYVVEAANTATSGNAVAHTGLGAHDVVVKLTGLVDLTDAAINGHALGHIAP
jgi:hypothetical protein